MKLNKETLAMQIYNDMKEQIVLGKIPSGQKVTIQDLQDWYQVSSTPAREGLKFLGNDGLVKIITNTGAYVSDFTLKESLDIHDLASLLDCYAVEEALRVADREELIEKLEVALVKHKEDDETNSLARQFYDNYFHNAFFEFVTNGRILAIKERNRSEFAIVVFKARYNRVSYDSQQEHQAVLDAIKAGYDELAVKKMREHFEHGKQRLLEYYKKSKF